MDGILYVAFGNEYDKMAAHCLAYSRRYTSIPMTVITNLNNDQRHVKWKEVDNIEFKIIPESQDLNRKVKTSLNLYTPYDKTLYLDCDTIIQKKGIEDVFNYINNNSVTLNIYGRWNSEKKICGLYKRALIKNNVSLPINVYYGALTGFGKSDKIDNFFNMWNKCWIDSGSGRDMPALACAVKKSGINVIELSNKNRVFTWIIRPEFTIQHEYGRHLRRLVGCSDFKQYKPFDRIRK